MRTTGAFLRALPSCRANTRFPTGNLRETSAELVRIGEDFANKILRKDCHHALFEHSSILAGALRET